jgi:hypothetical protein
MSLKKGESLVSCLGKNSMMKRYYPWLFKSKIANCQFKGEYLEGLDEEDRS